MASQKQARGGSRPRGGGQSRSNQNSGGQSRSNQNRGSQARGNQTRGGQNRNGQQGRGGNPGRNASQAGADGRATVADRNRRAPDLTGTGPAGDDGQAAVSARGIQRLTRLPGSMGWLPFTTLVLSVVGLLLSAYLTYTHFTNTALIGCSGKGDGCVLVQSSPESMVLGIFPVAVLGLAFYVFMVVINSPWAWRADWPAVHRARLASVVSGIGFVLYLVYTELIEIKAICRYCTSVHVVTFILFALIVFQATSSNAAIRRQPALPAARTRS